MTVKSNKATVTATLSDWLKNLSPVFSTNEKQKPKPIALCNTWFFSRSLRKVQVIVRNSDWFIALLEPYWSKLLFWYWFFDGHLKTALINIFIVGTDLPLFSVLAILVTILPYWPPTYSKFSFNCRDNSLRKWGFLPQMALDFVYTWTNWLARREILAMSALSMERFWLFSRCATNYWNKVSGTKTRDQNREKKLLYYQTWNISFYWETTSFRLTNQEWNKRWIFSILTKNASHAEKVLLFVVVVGANSWKMK